jgi:hypothetical protein
MNLRLLEKQVLEEKPVGKKNQIHQYREIICILLYKGYTKTNVHKKMKDYDLHFTQNQVTYYLNKFPINEEEMETAKDKVDKIKNIG